MSRPLRETWKANVLFAVLMLAVVALVVRLALLIRTERDWGTKLARGQELASFPIPARAGSIYALAGRRYVPLATSRQVPSCYADPSLMGGNDADRTKTAIRVGEALGLDPIRVYQELVRRDDSRFLWLKRDLTDREAEAIRALGHRAVRIQPEWKRVYPNEDLAATVVGFRRVDGVPGGGLELTHDAHLEARDGKNTVLVDACRRPLWPLVDESRIPRDGRHLLLHLDAVIQEYLQKAVTESCVRYEAKWGTGVVVDPQTGAILAMCSVPSFNPNRYSDADADRRTNRAVSCPFEPGSVAKPIFAAAAVDAGLLSWDTKIFCENGSYRAPRGGTIRDHHPYGWLPLTDVVVHSSNIGMAKVGEMVGNKTLHEVARRFGFGRRTGVELPGESPGIIRPLPKWDGYSLRRVPFGQEISVTSLQLAMAYCALANGGLLLEPRIVDRITDPNGQTVWKGERKVVRRVLSPAAASQALDVLRQVVERGTGKPSRLRHWTSVGKTGTAEIAGPGGYVEGAYVGSYVGGAPAEKPAVLCLISIYWPDATKGYYGGKVAAPYVKEVLAKTLTYLDVPPDRDVTFASAGR